MFNTWWFYITISLILDIAYNMLIKKALKKNVSDGALISLLQILSGAVMLVAAIFCKWKFPSDIKIYALLFASCIFYALSDRTNATARRGLEVSMYGLLSQIAPIFTFVLGILFFKEPIVLAKIVGLVLIILGNILVLYKKGKFSWNKYVFFSLLGNLFFSVGLCIDVGISDQFNLPFYIALTLMVPATLIILVERIKIKSLINEYKVGDKQSILLIASIWGVRLWTMFKAFQLGTFTTVTAVRATYVVINVIAAYFLLKERDSVWKKCLLPY